MKLKYDETQFALAAQSFKATLPERVEATDEDLGHSGFMRGYDALLERIRPNAVICYGEPFPDMRGNLYSVPVFHPR